jgi:hypothetical protein
VLVYDLNSASPNQGAFQVRLSETSADHTIVAGVAQATIATGESGLVLVRGPGVLRTAGGHVSGESVYLAASGQAGEHTGAADALNASVYPVAVMLEDFDSGETHEAFINIV